MTPPGGARDPQPPGAPGEGSPAPARAASPRFGCVVLTAGRSAQDLARALASLQAQQGVETDVVVVGNGREPAGLPAGIRHVYIRDPVGIPAGRNAGVPHVSGELLFFLDDDASLAEPEALARVARELQGEKAGRPRGAGAGRRAGARGERRPVGAVQLRVDALGGGEPLREWVPRLRARDRTRSGDVTALWEGAVAMPRAVFEEVGGWPGEFKFVHEGVDLAWRLLDAGYRVRYAGDIAVLHPPATKAVRHGYSLYYGARNRVLLARRHLPLPLAAVFVATFVLRTAPRLRTRKALQAAARGYRDGVTMPTHRRPLRAATLWRMTRAGRPPVL